MESCNLLSTTVHQSFHAILEITIKKKKILNLKSDQDSSQILMDYSFSQTPSTCRVLELQRSVGVFSQKV